MGDFLKLRPVAEVQVMSAQDQSASQFAQDYPYVMEHLTMTKWEDGQSREPSSFTVFLDEGKLKVCLHDKEMARVAFTAGWALEDALRALEEGLLAGTLDWRPARQSGPRRKS